MKIEHQEHIYIYRVSMPLSRERDANKNKKLNHIKGGKGILWVANIHIIQTDKQKIYGIYAVFKCM